MPGALKHQYELDVLAAIQTPLCAQLSLDELPRFVEALAVEQKSDAMVVCRIEPHATGPGMVTVNGNLSTHVHILCQRCLEPMELSLNVDLNWRMAGNQETEKAWIENDASADVVNVEMQPVDLLEWVEDELLLSLPLFAVHNGACGSKEHSALTVEVVEPEVEMARPFAELKNLLSKNKT